MVCTDLSRDQHDDVINCHLFSRTIANVSFNLIYGTSWGGDKLPPTLP